MNENEQKLAYYIKMLMGQVKKIEEEYLVSLILSFVELSKTFITVIADSQRRIQVLEGEIVKMKQEAETKKVVVQSKSGWGSSRNSGSWVDTW